MWWRIAIMIAGSCLLWHCTANVDSNPAPRPESATAQHVRFPPVQGAKRTLQVQAMRIPTADLERYPELAEQHVVMGLTRLLVETLSATGWFDLQEELEQLVTRLGPLWQRTEDGLAFQDEPRRGEGAPEFLMDVKLFDVVVCASEQKIALTREQLTCRSSVGIQVRIENTEGQFIPGSTPPLSPQGRYVHSKTMSRFGSAQTPFAQSAYGTVTAKAMRYAVRKAVGRFERQQW